MTKQPNKRRGQAKRYYLKSIHYDVPKAKVCSYVEPIKMLFSAWQTMLSVADRQPKLADSTWALADT